MRDNGPSRNAQYYFPLEGDLHTEEPLPDAERFDLEALADSPLTERDHAPSATAFKRFMSPDLYGKTGSVNNRSSSPFMRTAMSHYTPAPKPRTNQMFYTFGAKTKMRDMAPKSGAATPVRRPGTADLYHSTHSLTYDNTNVVRVEDPNVERRDYTKNLSQQIFFPGMTPEQFVYAAEKVAKPKPPQGLLQQGKQRRMSAMK